MFLFCSEEIDGALRKLKSGKSAGHDLLQLEHLKHGGEALKIWIQQVCNAIVELESMPNSLKLRIVTPIYKRVERIPSTSTATEGSPSHQCLPKLLESLILNRLQDVLLERGILHLNQTGCHKSWKGHFHIFWNSASLLHWSNFSCYVSVRSGGQLSAEFTLECGVLQGSVLSPVLFLLVMNHLIRELEHNSLGPSVHGTYAGAFAHANDILQ